MRANSLGFFKPVHLTRTKISQAAGLESCHPADFIGWQSRYSISMKILIADPHPEVQSALRLIAGSIPAVTEVCVAGSLVQLMAQCAQSCPNLILFDLDLVLPSHAHNQPAADWFLVLRRLCPCARIVAMSSQFEAHQEALAAGANGFISKTDAPDEVLSGILRTLENR
jgi:DNA-binding NarL/FixJ family response regulator